tara:strand:+ start:2540 stop:3454 length:915 start_codon:yes stop_codon:yes gene_type:complete
VIKKKQIIIFAYGFMGRFVYESFLKSKNFEIKGIILPNNHSIYKTSIDKKKIPKKIKILNSDNKEKIYNFIKLLKPNLIVVSTFNRILGPKILNLSNFINIHHGKLPKQKGRASINWALIMGRNCIYITIHEINSQLDAGKIIKQVKFKINPNDDYLSLQNKINVFLKLKISKILSLYLNNKIKLKNNNKNNETWNCSRNLEDGMINFFNKRSKVINLIKGLKSDKFGAFCFLRQNKITILDAKISNKKFEGIIPGRITKIHKNGSIECLCSDGPIIINKIKFKNKLVKPSFLIKSTRDTLLND